MNKNENSSKNNDCKENSLGRSNEQKEQDKKLSNPFVPDVKSGISQEDIDNEQQFKEALTERD